MKLDQQIESLLFFRGEPISLQKLAENLGVSAEEVTAGLEILKNRLQESGLAIVVKDDEVMLATRPEVSPLIEKLVKEELSRDLGKAGLETLSIILYRSPISRREIDYIRGVSSQFIVRNLLVRGLIEKIPSEKGERSFSYRPTFELLTYLGVTSLQELPEYTQVQEELAALMKKESEGEIEQTQDQTPNQTNG